MMPKNVMDYSGTQLGLKIKQNITEDTKMMYRCNNTNGKEKVKMLGKNIGR
jgi:hypothetical protein